MINLAIFISGRGSNFIAIKEKIDCGYIPNTKIALVFSNNPSAKGLAYAKAHNLETVCIPSREYTDKNAYDNKILDILKDYPINMICLAGYMRIITENLVNSYLEKIINIHPSILPSFKGAHAQKQALDYGVKYSGCTVHFVDNGVDTGPIIAQKIVPIIPGDTEDTLSARILDQEHILYPETLKAFAENRIINQKGKFFIKDEVK